MIAVYASGGNEEVRVYRLKPGGLDPIATVSIAPHQARFMAFSPDGRFAYGISGTPARVLGFAIDPATGMLTRLSSEGETGGNGSTHIAVHPSGQWAICAHFQGGQVSVVPLKPAPARAAQLLTISPEAHQVVFDEAGRFVFVPCRKGNVVHQFRFADGKLTPNDPPTVAALADGAGPRHLAFHPNQRWAYVICEQNGTVMACDYDAATGRLTPRHAVPAVPDGVAENASAHIAVHPSGRWVFASNRAHHSIARLAVDQTTGRLTREANETAGGLVQQPRSFTLDPSGEFLVVANAKSGTLLLLRIDDRTGALTLVGKPVAGLGAPSFVGACKLDRPG